MNKKRIALVISIAFLAVLAFFVGLRWGGQEGNSEEDLRKAYEQKEESVIKKAKMSEKELEEELISLVSLARNELGHWKEKEDHWVVKVKPNYESYKIQKKEYQELLRRIQIYIIEKLYSHLLQHERPYLVAKRLTQGVITETFDSLIRKNKGVTEDLFNKN